MKKKNIRESLFLLALLLLVGANPLWAAWSEDPANPTPISIAENAKLWPQLTATSDGYVVVWADERRGTEVYRDLYAQKFTADGEMLWTIDGRVAAEGPSGALLGYQQVDHSLVSNGEGGAIIHWNDFGLNTFVTQISSDENVEWGLPGVEIQSGDTAVQITGSGFVTEDLIPDSEGGVFSAITTNGHIHLVRFSDNGEMRTPVWYEGDRYPIGVVSSGAADGHDSVIIAYYSYIIGSGIYLKKISDPETNWPDSQDNLTTEWGPTYLPTVIPYTGDNAEIISDDAGGAFILWRDGSGGLYVQKVNADGSFAWAEEGVPLRVATDEVNRYPGLILDGAGGIVAFWENHMPWQLEKIRAQRIDANGIVQWAEGGIVISDEAYEGLSPQAILSSEGNYIIVYDRYEKYQRYDLVAQKLAGNGSFMWGAEGKVLSSAFNLSDKEKSFDIVSDNQGGVIAVFISRVGTDVLDKIYGARIYEDLPDMPDLTINKVTASSYWWDSKQITARVTVTNVGAADIPAGESCQVSLYLDDVNTSPVATEVLSGDLAVGDMNILRMQFSAPAIGDPGSYNLIIVVDSDGQINEEDEGNNVYNKAIKY